MARPSALESLCRELPSNIWVHAQSSWSDDLLWCPLISFDEDRKRIGFLENCQWCWSSERDEGSWVYSLEGGESIGILPLLEASPNSVANRLVEVCARTTVSPTDILAALPLERLTEVALQTHSDHWATCAIEWISALGPTRVVNQLTAASNDPRLDQRIRHRLRKLAAAS